MTDHMTGDARKRLAEDTTSRDEQGARDAAQIIGRHEWIGGDVGDQEPDPVWHKALGPDPWLPWTCQRCGTDTRTGMPETCPDCGMRNYG